MVFEKISGRVYQFYIFNSVAPRGRPEWGFKKPEPEPDFLSRIPVLINRNRIFSFPIRFLINRNRNFERSIRFLINRNRNSGWLPDFRFSIRFGHPLSLGSGMCTSYKHAYIQNKHIQRIHTSLILLTTALYAHASRSICLSFLPDFICLNPVLIDQNRNFKNPIRFLINRNRNFENSFRFLINRNRNSGKVPEFRFLIRFRSSPNSRLIACQSWLDIPY